MRVLVLCLTFAVLFAPGPSVAATEAPRDYPTIEVGAGIGTVSTVYTLPRSFEVGGGDIRVYRGRLTLPMGMGVSAVLSYTRTFQDWGFMDPKAAGGGAGVVPTYFAKDRVGLAEIALRFRLY